MTDTKLAMASLGSLSPTSAGRLRQLRYTEIFEALPAPSRVVAPRELQKFKEDHGHELHRLRTYLDGELALIASTSDPTYAKAMADQLRQDIRDQVDSLSKEMGSRKWPKVILVGLGGIIGAALGGAAAVATGGTAIALGLAVGAAVATTGGAAYSTVEIIRTPRFDRDRPLAYATLAQRSLGR